MRSSRRKLLNGRERDSLEGTQEETKILRKALIRRKSLAFSEDTYLEKESERSKVTKTKLEWD